MTVKWIFRDFLRLFETFKASMKYYGQDNFLMEKMKYYKRTRQDKYLMLSVKYLSNVARNKEQFLNF